MRSWVALFVGGCLLPSALLAVPLCASATCNDPEHERLALGLVTFEWTARGAWTEAGNGPDRKIVETRRIADAERL